MRVVLFLACLALASAKLPLHHAAKTHPLTKHAAPKHHPVAKANFSGAHRDNVEAQLAKLQKDISALTNHHGKELEEDKPMYLMMDVGSSGVKVYAYARRSSDCVPAPAPPGGGGWTLNQCGTSVKFSPSLYNWNMDEIDNFFNGLQYAMDTDEIEDAYARATAGQRIIAMGWNSATWARFEAGFAGLGLPADVEFSGLTIPGTEEALYEFLSNGRNYLSMGGASAQLGIELDTDAKIDAFFALLANDEIQDIDDCEGQQQGSGHGGGDFVKIVAPDGRGGFEYHNKATCKEDQDTTSACIGLVSWLATGAGDKGSCRTNSGYHAAGGNDGMRGTFYADNNANAGIAGDCFTQSTRDYDACYGRIVNWLGDDPQVELVARAVRGAPVIGITGFASARSIIGTDRGRAKFTGAARDPTFDPTTRAADANGRSNIGGAFWAMFTGALEDILQVNVRGYDDDVDWMPAYAEMQGLTAKCPIYQFAPDANGAKCGGNVGNLPAI